MSRVAPSAVARSAAMPWILAEGWRLRSSPTARSTELALRPLRRMRAPDSASPSAMAKPMPAVEAVTRAVLPERSMRMGPSCSLAQAVEITLRSRREPLRRERPCLRRIDDVLERSRHQHLANTRMSLGGAGHPVQQREAAADGAPGGAILLDGAGQIFAEAGVEKVMVVPDLEACFREKIGEVSLEVLVQTLQAGPRVAVSRHFALLHFGANTSSAEERRRAHVGTARAAMQYCARPAGCSSRSCCKPIQPPPSAPCRAALPLLPPQPVQQVGTKRVTGRQPRMLEIVAGIVPHAEPYHHGARARVGRDGEGDYFGQGELLEGEAQALARSLGRQPKPPARPAQPPHDLDARGEMCLEGRHRQPYAADQLPASAQLRRPQPPAVPCDPRSAARAIASLSAQLRQRGMRAITAGSALRAAKGSRSVARHWRSCRRGVVSSVRGVSSVSGVISSVVGRF